MAKCLIVGCGVIGTKLARALIAKGHTVTGLKRHPPATAEANMAYFAADITDAATIKILATDFEQVFFIVAPDGRDATSYNAVYDSGIDNLLTHFDQAMTPPAWIMVSSTSVYAQTTGEWVNEESLAKPSTSTSQAIRSAEKRLMTASAQHCIVRFSGIYGSDRDYLIRQAQQSPVIQQTPPYFTNRIHEQDCINVLLFLFEQRLAGTPLAACYLASDDDPATQWAVMHWLAEKLHCPPPIAQAVNASSANQNKRCSNARLKALGFIFQYPDYQTGYSTLIETNNTG